MAVQFGVFVPQGWRMDLMQIADPIEQYEAMTRVAQAVDGLSVYDSIWVYDHFHTVPQPTMETTFECWTSTAALARDTKRVKVGQMVTCNGYRHPSLLAKMASTVDVLSHGRLLCGLGAGWYENEWRAYGYGFPETRERMGMFREACEIVVRMWTEERPVFQGKYYTLDQPINEPKGVQQPHPPLWIGGSGEQVTLKLVAKWGNACNVFGDPAMLQHKYDVLRQHCETVGRNYDEIIRSTPVSVLLLKPGEDAETAINRITGGLVTMQAFRQWFKVGTADEIADLLRQMIAVGTNYFIIYLPMLAYDHEQLHRFTEEVIPQVMG
ncbi:MAG: LLM class F420-dependent oxidoreductase [Chloroflexaceae bacterium]|nr:LLM class F420-dependent oxidoreductase [Chloroflexaceae bacterium]